MGTPVKLVKGQPEYFAVLLDYKLDERSVLYVYDSKGGLVYEEVLPESGAGIAAVPDGKIGTEKLLIGSNNQVWQYEGQP